MKRWKAIVDSELFRYTKEYHFKFFAKAWVVRGIDQKFDKGYLIDRWFGRTIVIYNFLSDKTYPDPVDNYCVRMLSKTP